MNSAGPPAERTRTRELTLTSGIPEVIPPCLCVSTTSSSRSSNTCTSSRKRAFAGQNRADRLTPKRGRGIEFADHRPYTPGDDFRHIDWNAYRRLNRLLLRLFDEEQDLPIYLMLDVSALDGANRRSSTWRDASRRRSATSASRTSIG